MRVKRNQTIRTIPVKNTPLVVDRYLTRGGVFLRKGLSGAQPTVEFDSDEFNTKEINGVDSIIHHF